MSEEQELLELYKNKDIDKLFDKVGEYYHKWLNNSKKLDFYKQEIGRLNNIINESAEKILKELEENHHLSYGVALAIRQKLLDYKELKGE